MEVVIERRVFGMPRGIVVDPTWTIHLDESTVGTVVLVTNMLNIDELLFLLLVVASGAAVLRWGLSQDQDKA